MVRGGFDITPETRVSVNANQLWFDDTSVLEAARTRGNIDREIGTDLSLSIVWRPLTFRTSCFVCPGQRFFPATALKISWQ